MSILKVLFFGADPLSAYGDKRRLLLDVEAQKIEQEVIAALNRDWIDFRTCWATRIKELRRSLLRIQPHVVHFSGHGGEGGLVLVSSDGTDAHRVGADPLQGFFQAYSGQIRLVVLNACNSGPQAKAIAEAVGCAIGTRAKIQDQAAIAFSAAFYSSIAFGESVQKAFDQACATLRMEGFAENQLPVLHARSDVDPSKLVLVTEETRRPRRRAAGAAATLTSAAVAGMIWWPGALPPACDTAREVLASVRETHGTVTPQGLMGGAAASGGPAAAVMNDAKDLYAAGDYARAFPLFKQAAIAGNVEARSFVGVAYLRGEGVAPNPDSATIWLEYAKDSRDPRGMNGVGEAYQANRTYRWAMHWYEAAANRGFPEAIRNVGSMYRDGLYVQPDGDRALALFEESAKAGFADAMVDAGAMYEHGVAVPADARAARCWYDAAARAGSPAGMVELGQMHEARGKYRKARDWYQRAADAGNADALNNLGRLHQNGWGVRLDLTEARRLYQRAAERGSEVARGNLARLRV
jgi:TPR repeat protein